MPETKQIITGDSGNAQKAYADLARQVVKVEEANQRLSRVVDQGATKGSQGQMKLTAILRQQVAQVASAAMAVLSLGSAWNAAKGAAEEYMTVSDRIRQTKVDIAQAQTTLGLNTLNKEQFRQAKADISNIARQTGFSNIAALTEAYSTAINAAPGKTPAEQMENASQAVRQGASLTKHSPELLDAFVGGSLDVATSAGISPQEAYGLNLTAGKFARISNPERQQTAISKTISSIVASSDVSTPEKRRKAAESGAEFWAAYNKASKDKLGERSTTAVEQFGSRTSEAFEQGITYTPRGRSRPVTLKPKDDPGDITGRLEYLQKDPRFAKAFLDTYSFESGAKERYRQAILDPKNSEFAQALKDAKPSVGYDAQIYGSAKDVIETGSKQLETAGRDQASLTRDTLTKMEGLDQRGLASEARTIRNRALETTGGFGVPGGFVVDKAVGGTVRNFDDWFGSDADAAERAIRELETKRRGIKRGTLVNEGVYGSRQFRDGEMGGRRDIYREKTTEEAEADKTLADAINSLKPILEQQRELQTRQLEEVKGKRPSSAPATRAEAGRHRER